MELPNTLNHSALTEALKEVFADLRAVTVDLGESDWDSATRLPGWSVRDVMAHVIGTESMLAGHEAPTEEVEPADHIRNDIGTFNETWVQAMRHYSAEDMVEALDVVTEERLAALTAMTQEEFDEPSWTPAGQATYGRFMQIRVFDCWMHLLDICDALAIAATPSETVVARALAEVVNSLGFVVGKKAGVAKGQSVAFVLTGATPTRMDVLVEDRARVVAEPIEHPSAVLTCSVDEFAALIGGRVSTDESLAAGRLELGGDESIGRLVANNLAYVI
jgi:uncharacterized protein (TIGR03083 family)